MSGGIRNVFGRSPVPPPKPQPPLPLPPPTRLVQMTVRDPAGNPLLAATGTLTGFDSPPTVVEALNVAGRLVWTVAGNFLPFDAIATAVVSAPGFQSATSVLTLVGDQVDLTLTPIAVRPASQRQAPFTFDKDDPGGNGKVWTTPPPEQVFPTKPLIDWPIGNFSAVELDFVPPRLYDAAGHSISNTTPPNSTMSFQLRYYERAVQDKILAADGRRGFTHFLDAAEDVATGLHAYVLSWMPFAGFWIGPWTIPQGRSWATAQPVIQPTIDALKAAGSAVCSKTICILGKELDGVCSPEGLTDIIRYAVPQLTDLGCRVWLHFNANKPGWPPPGRAVKDWWAIDVLPFGVVGCMWQGRSDSTGADSAGTMGGHLWDTRKMMPRPGLVCAFEPVASAQLYGKLGELDGVRRCWQLVCSTRALDVPAVAGAWNGLWKPDGTPILGLAA